MKDSSDFLSLLFVEDEMILAESFNYIFSDTFNVFHAGSLEEGLSILQRHTIDICLLDLLLPDAEDLVAFWAIRRFRPYLAIVIYTSLNDTLLAKRAFANGAQDFCFKGSTHVDEIAVRLQWAYERGEYRKACLTTG